MHVCFIAHVKHLVQLGLGHTLSRYKLKFSPDKVDTMIVQVSIVYFRDTRV
jgi:RNA processing factor Prp31